MGYFLSLGRPLSQVNFTEINSSSGEIDFGDVGNLHAVSDVGNYLANRSTANEYRDVGRSADCDGFETFAGANLVRRHWRGKKERRISQFGSHPGAHIDKFKRFRAKRFRNSKRRYVSEKRKSKLSTDVGFNSVFDYDQMGVVRSPGGKYARFECGNTAHFREECPVY